MTSRLILPVLTEIAFAQRSRLFCWVPVCLAIGIGGYFSLAKDPSTVQLAAILLVAVACGFGALFWRSYWRFLFWIPSLFAIGFLATEIRVQMVSGPKIGWHYYGPVEGTIAHIDRSTSDKPRLLLTDPVLSKFAPGKTPERIRISLHSKVAGTDLQPGLRVMTTARLSPPAGPVEPGGFDFQRKAWFQRLGAVGYTKVPVLMAAPAQRNSASLYLFSLRMRISAFVQNQVSGQPGAFAAAILTGDRSRIDPERMKELRGSNLAHLLAISGLHMGLLTGFVFALVRYGLALWPSLALRLPTKKVAAVVALLAGFAYLLLSGGNVATQRAFVMVSVMIVAVLIDRPAITLRAVALAAILILIARPESLLEPGFQMSFAATTSLVATFEYLNRSPVYRFNAGFPSQAGKWILTLTISSGVAGAATAPISAFHFNQISQFGLLANLASVPVMGVVVMPSAVIAGILSMVGVSGPAFTVMGLGVEWILGVAGYVSGLDNATRAVSAAPTAALAVLSIGALCLFLLNGRLRMISLPVVILAAFLWTADDRPDILIADNGRLVGLVEDGLRHLNRDKGSGFAARSWLENDGDKAAQVDAAIRFQGSRDDWSRTFQSTKVAYRWGKTADSRDLHALCSTVDLLIAPNWQADLSGSCILVDRTALKRGGAHSVGITKDGVFVQTARDVSGFRIWNSKP